MVNAQDDRIAKIEAEQQIITLNSEIKRLLKNLDLAQDPEMSFARYYTSFDIELALQTVQDVLQHRLSGTPDEYQGDLKRNYESLWTSIEEEIKDAVKTLFTLRSEEQGKLPLFVNDFNRLVVTRLIKIMALMGPEKAAKAAPAIIKIAQNAVVTTALEYTNENMAHAKRDLRTYSQAHAKQVAAKKAFADRLKVIREVALQVQNEALL